MLKIQKEKWKRFYINGIKTRYKVSSYGRVYNTKEDKFVRTRLDPKGYYKCSITVAHKTYLHMFVHRMVALMFVHNPKPDEYDVVDHINGVKTCNNYLNLRWCTKSMNSKYAIKLGLIKFNHEYGDKSPNHKYTGDQVDKAILMMNGEFTYKDIEEATGIDDATIRLIYKRKAWIDNTKGKKLKIKHGRRFISEEDLSEAIKMLQTGSYTLKEISTKCNMNVRTVAAIIDRLIHRDLTEGLELSVIYPRKNTETHLVLKVIEMLNGKYTYKEIVEATGVPQQTVYKILNHRAYTQFTEGKTLSIKK